MADVVLTHSYHLLHDAKQVRKMQPYAPLGTLYAAAALHAADIPIAIFDTTLENPAESFPAFLRHHRPLIVVIYEDDFNFLSKMCLTTVRATAFNIAQMAQKAGHLVIAHGSDATDHSEDYLRNGVDYILTGEAEHTLVELCSRFLRNLPVTDIPGLLSIGADGHLSGNTGCTVLNPEWSYTPRIARELLDLEPYRAAWKKAHGYFSANVVASRGCPYQCNWCAKPISGNKFNLREPESVAAEIRELKELYGVQHIWFGDDIFALNRHWIQQFANELEQQNAVLPFKIQSRADLMSQETVDALARAGCDEVWMGVESGSQKILNAMDKNLSIADVYTARERLRSAGIRACFFLQLGYPGEGWGEIQQTIELIRSARPDDIGVSVSYPLPGTRFYEKVQASLGTKRNWRDSDDLCAMFTAAYSNDFYLALRDALHAEVNSWSPNAASSVPLLETLWERVRVLEPRARNASVTELIPPPAFIPIEQLAATGTGETV